MDEMTNKLDDLGFILEVEELISADQELLNLIIAACAIVALMRILWPVWACKLDDMFTIQVAPVYENSL